MACHYDKKAPACVNKQIANLGEIQTEANDSRPPRIVPFSLKCFDLIPTIKCTDIQTENKSYAPERNVIFERSFLPFN